MSAISMLSEYDMPSYVPEIEYLVTPFEEKVGSETFSDVDVTFSDKVWVLLREQTKVTVHEDPSDYVKIKDGLYVFSLIEEMGARSERKKGNNLLFLMNLKRMYDVGRSYGHNDVGEEENYTYGAYGEYHDSSETLRAKSTEFIR